VEAKEQSGHSTGTLTANHGIKETQSIKIIQP